MNLLPLGFNEAKTFRLSPSVTPEVAHGVKCCVHTELTQRDDLAIFYSVETLDDHYRDYKQKNAPDVTDDVWEYFDTATALFDTWIEYDDLHIVLYDDSQREFVMLQNITDIHGVGSTQWRTVLLDALRTQKWRGRSVKVYVATADLVWM